MRRRIVRWLFRWVYRVAFAERVDHTELLEARNYTPDELEALRAVWRQHTIEDLPARRVIHPRYPR